jgi:hypothetical protein
MSGRYVPCLHCAREVIARSPIRPHSMYVKVNNNVKYMECNHAKIEPVSQEEFSMWFAYIHC